MTGKAIVHEASYMETTLDLAILLNKIKEDELGLKAYPFTLRQLSYFINPKRNRGSYQTFTIPKRSGGVRTISAPTGMLKSLLGCMKIFLQVFYEAPEAVTGFVPERNVVGNARKHIGMNYVFNTDLKDFFPSITKSRVWATLKMDPFNFNDTIADAIAGLCCTYVNQEGEPDLVALPQGSPCSPILTNIICRPLDRKLQGLARRFGLHYSRYADDITFSGMRNVFHEDGEFITELRRIIRSQHFQINEKKTRLQKRGERQEVTGLVVSDRGVNVTREYVRDLDNLLYIWKRHGRAAAFTKFTARHLQKQVRSQNNFNMERVVAGRLAYLQMVKGWHDPVWRKLQERFDGLSETGQNSIGDSPRYLQYYTIDHFKEFSGLDVRFDLKDGYVDAFFEKDGVRNNVLLSKYCHTRLSHILQMEDPSEALAAFTRRAIVAYCENAGGQFWMIVRSLPSQKSLQKQHERHMRRLAEYYPELKRQYEEAQQLRKQPEVNEFIEDLVLDVRMDEMDVEPRFFYKYEGGCDF